jgi:hypothetical protein
MMTDIDRAAMSTMVEPIKALNSHIESLENDLRYRDPIFGSDYGWIERIEWIGELKRERAVWIEDLRREFGKRGIQPSKPWPRR